MKKYLFMVCMLLLGACDVEYQKMRLFTDPPESLEESEKIISYLKPAEQENLCNLGKNICKIVNPAVSVTYSVDGIDGIPIDVYFYDPITGKVVELKNEITPFEIKLDNCIAGTSVLLLVTINTPADFKGDLIGSGLTVGISFDDKMNSFSVVGLTRGRTMDVVVRTMASY